MEPARGGGKLAILYLRESARKNATTGNSNEFHFGGPSIDFNWLDLDRSAWKVVFRGSQVWRMPAEIDIRRVFHSPDTANYDGDYLLAIVDLVLTSFY